MTELPVGTVTFLFTDIEGSTRLWEEHPEEMRLALARHDTLLREAIAVHHGEVFKTVGDAFYAAFPVAADAVAAALAIQRALGALPPGAVASATELDLRVRTALHTGAAEARDGDYFGAALSRVARLQAIGHGGQVLVSAATRELVQDDLPPEASLRDLGAHRLRDLHRPEQVSQLLHPALPADFPPLRSLDARRHNLPVQPTPLLGREEEVARACALLRQEPVRLLTLTGPGGTGKTRLGLQVAGELIDDYPDGVFFVALAPITDPGLVASTLARTLGVVEAGGQPLAEALQTYLRPKRLLLVLDNCEQVLAAAPMVADLLSTAPRVKMIATSRAALRVRGEQELPVPPLAVPEASVKYAVLGVKPDLSPRESRASTAQSLTLNTQHLLQYAAVELFIQRALNVQPRFAVTNENAPAVAAICRRLEGLPLAIELAAARVRLFPPATLLARLESRLNTLTGGARDLPVRQQTLRNAIAWSYDLLGAAEQTLFRRLSVMAGGCTLAAAEAVGDAGGDLGLDVAEGVLCLVEQNLLRQEEDQEGEPRLTMMETLREFGWEELQRSGEQDVVCERHRDWFLQLAEQHRGEADSPAFRGWLERLERERDNLRAALAWSLTEPGGEAKGLRLAAHLGEYWLMAGRYTEGREWLAKIAAKVGEGPSLVRAQALGGSAWLAYEQGHVAEARTLQEERLAILRELGETQGLPPTLWCLGGIAVSQGQCGAARAFCEESLALARVMGSPWGVGWSLHYLAGAAAVEGDLTTARALGEESVAVLRRSGSRFGMAYPLGALGSVIGAQGDLVTARALAEEALEAAREMKHQRAIAWSLALLGDLSCEGGDHAAAQGYFRESLTLLRELGHRSGLLRVLEGFASLAAAQWRHERAARLLGVVEASGAVDYEWWQPLTRVWYRRAQAALRAVRDEASVAEAWADGVVMALEDAIADTIEDEAD